jgi:hypothetical protein
LIISVIRIRRIVTSNATTERSTKVTLGVVENLWNLIIICSDFYSYRTSSHMAGAEDLRSQAARLRAAAMKAYENGEVDSADILIARAMQCLDEADSLDRRRRVGLGANPE